MPEKEPYWLVEDRKEGRDEPMGTAPGAKDKVLRRDVRSLGRSSITT